MSTAGILAEHVVASRYDDLPTDAIRWSRAALLDTLGVMLAGSAEAAPRILAAVLGCREKCGPSLLLGTRMRAFCLDAATVNGTAAHALDFDNATNTMYGHASAAIIPALLAAGEQFGAGGQDVLVAHVAGFEVGARIGRGVNMHHYKKGWHPSSTLGVFAAAAASSRLLRLTAAQTEMALGLSASLASGIKANFGTMTKPLHVGQCARNGLLAALLAREGFTANPHAIEHEQGFLNVFNGEAHYDLARIVEGWGDPFDIVAPGACYKQYPCCASTHAAVDAALALVRRHGPFDAKEVRCIDSWISAPRLAHTNRPLPTSTLDAKFSVQYCIACALLNGAVDFEHFEDMAYQEPAIQALLPLIHAMAYEPDEFPDGNLLGAKVMVTLTNGQVFTARVEQALGRTSANPIGDEKMRRKFLSCAQRVLDPTAAQTVLQMIDSFESLDSIKDFMHTLQGGLLWDEPRLGQPAHDSSAQEGSAL